MAIAGGDEIAIGSAPWQVELFAEYASGKGLACGGAILDSTHILTAAHCAYDPETGTRLEASAFVTIAGIAPVTVAEIENNPATEARLMSVVRVHPMFQYSLGPGAPDDVAVLTLAKALSFDATVQPMGLAPAGASLLEGVGAILTGFGEQQYGVEANFNLYSLSMAASFPGDCGGEADAVFVCANSFSGSGCSGDSGSALTSGSSMQIVGVMDTIEQTSSGYCQAGSGNGFVNTSAPEIRDFLEGSETPPVAPRGGKGVVFQGEGKEGDEAKIGVPLSCEPGTWSGSPTLAYVFVDSANGLVLQSGSSSTYTPSSEDVGRGIYCEVRASNAGGTGLARTPTAREPSPPGGGEIPTGPTESGEQWFSLPAMSEQRARQTATLLGDGEVLVAGGYDGFGPKGGSNVRLGGAQLLDPASGKWSEAAPMLFAREGQTATLLNDGDVLVMGGSEMPEAKEGLKSAELYDPDTNTWTPVAAPPELVEVHSATLLHDGRVLVTGVFKGTWPGIPGTAIYDPTSGNWHRAAAPLLWRYDPAVALLPNGKVIVMGGWEQKSLASVPFTTTFTTFASVEEYDPATDTWSKAAPMAHARAYQTATLMPGGEVLVTGGIFETDWGINGSLNSLRSTEAYDPQTNRWSARAPTVLPRAQDTATLMPDGRVLVAGGYDCGLGSGCLGYGGIGDCCGANSAEVYDPSSNAWMFTPPILTGVEHTATLLPEGGVLITGGNLGPISNQELSSAEIYTAHYPPDEPSSPPAKATGPEPPAISHLTESHKRWRRGSATARMSATKSKKRPPLGTAFMFTLNEKANIVFTFTQQLAGRRAHGRCLPSRKGHGGRPCQRAVLRGKLTFTGRQGHNRVRFDGRLSGWRSLASGRYTLSVDATNAVRQRAKTRRLTFTIVE
jgi:N-acetylneuraminic acid mutarotase